MSAVIEIMLINTIPIVSIIVIISIDICYNHYGKVLKTRASLNCENTLHKWLKFCSDCSETPYNTVCIVWSFYSSSNIIRH